MLSVDEDFYCFMYPMPQLRESLAFVILDLTNVTLVATRVNLIEELEYALLTTIRTLHWFSLVARGC